MPFTTFVDWSTILSTSKDILAGKVSAKDVAIATLNKDQV